MNDLVIRRAENGDLPRLVAHNLAMAEETEGKILDAARVSDGTRAVLGDERKGFYLLARRGDAVIGQLMITYEWSDWRNGVFWWIQSVYVVPAERRQGVYRALYAHVSAMARKTENVCGVRLYVEKENRSAQETYRALGMNRTDYLLFEVDYVLGESDKL
ncbi:MAG: GNAT family N-acetyltransferase [Myxococcales bacterium]|nr:GNAT family N-acetyltransferase [Myxococcales bacterium]